MTAIVSECWLRIPMMSAGHSDRCRPLVPIEVGRPFRLMSAGVAGRPLVGCDLSITGCMGSSGDGFGPVLLAQTVTSELQSVSIVDDPVEDGVGQGRLANQVVPAVDGDLASDQRGAGPVAVFDDFEHVVALLRPKRLETPIVEDQELDAAEGTHQTRVAAVAACQGEIAEHARDTLIKHRAVVAAGLVAEGAGQPALADAGGPFDDQVLRLLDPTAGNQGLE